MANPTPLRAIEAFAVGPHRVIAPGDIVSSADPIVKGKEHLFEEVVAPELPAVERPVAKRAAKGKASG